MTSESGPRAILEIRGITKEFSGVKALDDVSMSFRAGEVHALVGENGAGKSTLMKILSGVYQPTRGSLSISGETVSFRTPKQAQDAGIGMIFQEFSLIRSFDVADNVFLNREPVRGPLFIDKAAERRRAISLFQEIGFDIDVDRRAGELSVVEQQVVEIVKALSVAARVLIMDEPSAVLTDKELKRLFKIIRALKARGVTVIYISHMLDEVFEISDRVTVLKDGRFVGTKDIRDTDRGDLVRMMVGREISEFFPESTASRGAVLLEARGLGVGGRLRGASFSLHEGEILGVAGMAGSGQAALAGAIIGTERADEGELFVAGRRAAMRDFRDVVGRGIGFIPEDRKAMGILAGLSLKDNITIASLGRFLRLGFLLPRAERKAARSEADRLRIKSAGLGQRIETLSGGNQQKALLARWLLMGPKILVLVEPTRGVDVGAKMEIYRIMREFVDSGRGILMISSELPEVIGLSDRILVMRGGAIEGAIDQSEGLATEEAIMSMAVGHRYSYSEEAGS